MNLEIQDVTLLQRCRHWLLLLAHARFQILMLSFNAKLGEILCMQGVSDLQLTWIPSHLKSLVNKRSSR